MQESLSLISKKNNIINPASSKNKENIQEQSEKQKNNNKIKRAYYPISVLHLPVKKMNHITNKKEKKKMNKISLEKLRQIIINLRMNKREKNHDKKNKKLIHIKKPLNASIKINKNIKQTYKAITTEIKSENKNNTTKNININIKEYNYKSEKNKKDIDILKNELSQSKTNRNENKKWYDSNYLTEKYNDLILTTEKLEKNLIDKYLTGTENIISEIEEPKYLKEDSEIINTINANPSSRKHLSIRETTLDTSYQGNSYYNHTDKLKGKTNALIGRIKNYRQIFKKYKTNITFKRYNKSIVFNRYNNDKIRQKNINSLTKVKTQNNSYNNSFVERHTNHRNNSESLKITERLRHSHNETRRNIFLYKNKRNIKNKSDVEENKIQFLSIINEANDLIKSDCKKKYYRPKSKNIRENKDSNKKKYNSKYIKNKFKQLQQSINNINPINLFKNEKKKKCYIKNRYNTTNINYYINSALNEYDICSDIGIGSYAEVKLGIHKKTLKKYAIKIYLKDSIDDEDKKNSIKNEIYILNQLNHENIMKLYDIINTPKYFYLILEYINGISLLDYINKSPNKKIDENFCKKIVYQIIKALDYCSKKNIFHRDIKLENILLTKNDTIKLIDFGFAIKCNNKNEFQNFFCGTLYYMSPEIINKKKYLPYYSDIWSLGILLYTMIYGKFPFNANNNDDLFNLINEGKVEFPEDINTSNEVKNLIKKIIVVEPCKRPSLSNIMNDPWFKN